MPRRRRAPIVLQASAQDIYHLAILTSTAERAGIANARTLPYDTLVSRLREHAMLNHWEERWHRIQ